MTANYLAETDFLLEAGAILRGETRKLPTLEHLKALEQVVRRADHLLRHARIFINDPEGEPEGFEDWLREAAKLG